MKKWIIAFLLSLSATLCWAQPNTQGGPTPGLSQPDCSLPFSFTAAGSSASFDNRSTGCASWHVYYYGDNCSVVSLQPQFAPDANGVAGAFSIWPASQVFGVLPLAATTETQVTFSAFHPWVNVKLTTATGCTLVTGKLIGWKPQGSPESTAAAAPSQGAGPSGALSVGFPQLIGGQYNTTANVPALSTGFTGTIQEDDKGRALVGANTLGFSTNFNAYMQAVPLAATTLTATTGAYRFFCNNTTAGAVTLTITDNQGSPVAFLSAFSVAANTVQRFPPGEGYLRMQGVKWNAGAATSINCGVDGWQ